MHLELFAISEHNEFLRAWYAIVLDAFAVWLDLVPDVSSHLVVLDAFRRGLLDLLLLLVVGLGLVVRLLDLLLLLVAGLGLAVGLLDKQFV